MEDASPAPKKPLIPAKYGPWLLSLLGGSSLVIFWSYLDQSQRPWTAGQLPPALTGNVGTGPATNIPTSGQTSPPAARPANGYKDGTYTASSNAPWGAMTIAVTVRGGQWTDIQTTSIPDSPPSYYAAPQLVQQALAAQSAGIDGVSGATYTSNAFRDDLSQIVRQSAK